MCTQKHEIDDILQLLADEDVDPDALASGLEDLAQALAAHRLGFKSVQEYAIVLALLHSHPHHVAAVLVAAGSAPDAKDSRVHMPEAAAPTVSWPPLVVQRLAMAMDFKREPIAARRAVQLLAWAAQDPLQRRSAFAADAPSGRGTNMGTILRALSSLTYTDGGSSCPDAHAGAQDLGQPPLPLRQLSLEAMWDTVSMLSCFISSAHPEDLHIIWAADQHPLLLLLRLHAAIPHVQTNTSGPLQPPASSSSAFAHRPRLPCPALTSTVISELCSLLLLPAAAAASDRPLCCATAHAAAACICALCTSEHLVLNLRSELLRVRSGAEADSTPRHTQEVPTAPVAHTQPLKGAQAAPGEGMQLLLMEARRIVHRCPAALQPELGSDLGVKGYGKGRAPVDLCVSPLPQPPAPQTRTLRPQSVAVPSPPGAYHPLATGKVAAAATGAAPGAGTRAGRPQVQGFLAQAPGPSLLERWLDALAGVARAGRALALGLYSLEIVALLTHVGQAFGGHPPVVQAVERVYGALASNCQAVVDEAVMDSSLHALIGIVCGGFSPGISGGTHDGCHQASLSKSSRMTQLSAASRLRALGKLAQLVDTCSGDDFMQITRKQGVMAVVLDVLDFEEAGRGCIQSVRNAEVYDAAQSLFLGCLERARRALGLEPQQAPRIGIFGQIRPRALLQLEACVRQRQPAPNPLPLAGASAAGIPRDSYGPAPLKHGKDVGGDGAGTGGAGDVARKQYGGEDGTPAFGVGTVKGKGGAKQSGSRSKPGAVQKCCAAQGNRAEDGRLGDGYDSDGVRMVWASGPTPQVHAVRLQWLAAPLAERLRWDQSSDSIMLWLQLPPGTTKHDVSVKVTAQRLTVCLRWAGRVLDGPLSRQVKASEALWVIETSQASRQPVASLAAAAADTGTQLHVMLPKRDRHYWRSVFEGGLEKSHVEILREAVQADEPVVQFDDLDDEAKSLVEDFRERQWMISNGHLSMENSLDDFRVVIGDNTL